MKKQENAGKLPGLDESSDVFELKLKDLENVAGGRKMTVKEVDDYSDVTRKLRTYCRGLSAEEKERFKTAFNDLEMKWVYDIADAPESAGDILFSEYVKDLW